MTAALVIVGVGAYSWAESTADQASPAAVTSQEGDSDSDGRNASTGNRGGNGRDRDIEPVACDEARTHGEYVSSVARSTPSGPGKGAVVSAAARSDCGKPDRGERAADAE